MNENDGTEKRAILAIVLSLAVFWLWTAWFAPPQSSTESLAEPSQQAATQMSDGSQAEAQAGASPEDGSAVGTGSGPQAAQAPEAAAAEQVAATGSLPERTAALQSDQWDGELTTRGGVLRSLVLPQHDGPYVVTPIYSWVIGKFTGKSDESWQPYSGGDQPERLLSEAASFGEAGGMDSGFLDGDYELVDAQQGQATFSRVGPSGLKITKSYRISDQPYQGELTVRFENPTAQPLRGRLWVGVGEDVDPDASRYSNSTQAMSVLDGSLEIEDDFDDFEAGPVSRPGAVSWLGIANRYFLSAMVPLEPGWGRLVAAARGENHASLYLVAEDVTLEPGATHEVELMLYAGPKGHASLKALGHDLEQAVQFGFFGFFAKILYWMLVSIQKVLGNWGLSIIVLTLVVKAAFFPLTQKSMKSMQEFKKQTEKIKPALDEVKEKYKDDREMQTQETMRLYKEHGVNPMGGMTGCLPMLIQMPIWFALYSTLLYSVDLYHSKFLVWQDLSGQDPFCVLPLIVGGLMFLQQTLTPMTGMDPAQARMMRLMPLIFVFFIFSFPSGLALYITVNSVLSIIQQHVVNRKYRSPAASSTTKESDATPKNKKKQRKKARA